MTKIALWHHSEKEKQALKDAGYAAEFPVPSKDQPTTSAWELAIETKDPPFLVARKLFEAGANVCVIWQNNGKDVLVGVADDLFRMR